MAAERRQKAKTREREIALLPPKKKQPPLEEQRRRRRRRRNRREERRASKEETPLSRRGLLRFGSWAHRPLESEIASDRN